MIPSSPSRVLALPLLLGAGALFSGSQEPIEPPDQDTGGPEEVLREADRAFQTATEEYGLEGWLSWFAPEALVLDAQGSVVSGAEALGEHYRAVPGFPPQGFRWEPVDAGLAESGDLGWTAGTYTLGEGPVAGHYLSVWERVGEDWRVVTDLGGEPAFRTRLVGLAGPPRDRASESLATRISAAGDLALTTGTWTAGDPDRKIRGRFLSVWSRSPDGSWAIVTEIGTTDS